VRKSGEMKPILISGIPGTGKTSFGEWMAKTQGFLHLDMEDFDGTVHQQKCKGQPVAREMPAITKNGTKLAS
jgi:adenylate kinase family enzyme